MAAQLRGSRLGADRRRDRPNTAHIHPEDRKILLDLLARFSAGEIRSATAICRVLHDDGRKTWIKTHLICRDFRPEERVIDMLGINYDITALKETEQELIAAKERARSPTSSNRPSWPT